MSWTVIGIAIAAGLSFVAAVFGYGRKSGADAQKVKEGKAREQDLNQIKRAADAGARVQPDDPGVLNDPFNRDRKP